MATSVDFVEFVCEQIAGAGAVRYRKMFGEYMVYVNDKPIVLVCDDTAFVKIVPCIEDLMQGADKGFPYDGAKEHFVLNIDNTEHCREVVAMLEANTRVPEKRKKKGS